MRHVQGWLGAALWLLVTVGALRGEDCNQNGIPDVDDILAGTARDCNGNGIPDDCDIAAGASLDVNANGLPDECEPGVMFHRGDGNDDGASDVSDFVSTVNYLLLHGPTPPCLDAADANDDDRVDLADAIYTLNYLFRGGRAFPPPGGVAALCDVDPAPAGGAAGLGCASYSHCRAGG